MKDTYRQHKTRYTHTRGYIPKDPVDRRDGGRGGVGTHALRDEFFPDLPGEDGWVLPLVLLDLVHHLRGRHFRLGSPYHAGRSNGSCREKEREFEP